MKALSWTCLATVAVVSSLPAQRIETLSQNRDVRRVYQSVVERATKSVVEIVVGKDPRILGTVVAPDLVVTKFSTLKLAKRDAEEASDKLPKLVVQQGKQSWPCTVVGFDRPADLLLLRVGGAKLKPVQWQKELPQPGAFFATPDIKGVPLGIGILAAAPYVHTQQRAFLGIRFANPTAGPALLDEVVDNGAAEAAGLKGGDTVIRFEDYLIKTSDDLRSHLRQRKPGDRVKVEVQRGDKELAFEVVLGTNNSPAPSNQEPLWGPLSSVRSGFREVLQHDTVLYPGDCGGPLVDLSGKVVGVNIARAGRVETLALPAKNVQQIVARLVRKAPGDGK